MADCNSGMLLSMTSKATEAIARLHWSLKGKRKDKSDNDPKA